MIDQLVNQLGNKKPGSGGVITLDVSESSGRGRMGILAVSALVSLGVLITPFSDVGPALPLSKAFGVIVVMLGVLAMLVSYKNRRYIDLEQEELRLESSCLGRTWRSDKTPLTELLELGVSGSRRESTNSNGMTTSVWWEYGLSVLTDAGKLIELIPDYNRDQESVIPAARALAGILKIEMIEPEPARELRVGRIDDKLVLAYVRSAAF